MTDPTPSDDAVAPGSGRAGPALHSAELLCDTCGHATPHRILHLARGPGSASPRGSIRGVAKCRECGSVHPFATQPPRPSVSVAVVISDGPRSLRRSFLLPQHRRLQIGSGVPDSEEPWIIRGIDRSDGRRVPEARAEEIATLWVERDHGPRVAVSIIEGHRTRSLKIPVPDDASFEVGEPLRVEGIAVHIVRLRAHGQNWERTGDRFPAREIQRLYARRTRRPPAGSSDWSRDRESPESRES